MPLSKDPNPEWLWSEYEEVLKITVAKKQTPKWGPRKTGEFFLKKGNIRKEDEESS